MPDETLIEALLREREGYARRGRADRIAAVDEALKAAGYKGPLEAPVETTATKPTRPARKA